MAEIFIGVDTSCYTTSLAVYSIAGDILINERMLLPVEKDKHGLRQSDAVFLHIKNMHSLFAKHNIASLGQIRAIAASVKPRPQEGSYMPVFQVSDCIARSLASTSGAFFYDTTHQHAHIFAAMENNTITGDFLAVHLSGGTSEILFVKPSGTDMEIDILGKTLDIPAGQLIDRIGSALGFGFPCGPELECCAAQAKRSCSFKASVATCDFHFSGVEAQAMRAIRDNVEANELCFAIQKAIAQTIAKALMHAGERTGIHQVLLFGGVISNAYIKSEIENCLQGMHAVFAQKEFSADNAVGLAVYAKNKYCTEDLQ